MTKSLESWQLDWGTFIRFVESETRNGATLSQLAQMVDGKELRWSGKIEDLEYVQSEFRKPLVQLEMRPGELRIDGRQYDCRTQFLEMHPGAIEAWRECSVGETIHFEAKYIRATSLPDGFSLIGSQLIVSDLVEGIPLSTKARATVDRTRTYDVWVPQFQKISIRRIPVSFEDEAKPKIEWNDLSTETMMIQSTSVCQTAGLIGPLRSLWEKSLGWADKLRLQIAFVRVDCDTEFGRGTVAVSFRQSINSAPLASVEMTIPSFLESYYGKLTEATSREEDRSLENAMKSIVSDIGQTILAPLVSDSQLRKKRLALGESNESLRWIVVLDNDYSTSVELEF